MESIISPNDTFDFSKLSLAQPSSIQGGAYFTKLLFENGPLYIQTPKSSTKQGFLKSGKKISCDLMFDNTEEGFVRWMESLETRCQDLIFQKSSEWFQNSLEMNDIETAFNSPMKMYKSGKYYLVRTNVKVNSLTSNAIIKIYNENETALTMDDINSDSNVISILEVQGLKFTSRSFQIEIELRQMMMLNKKDFIFESCLIKKNNLSDSTSNIYQNATPLSLSVQTQKDLNEKKLEEEFLKTNNENIEINLEDVESLIQTKEQDQEENGATINESENSSSITKDTLEKMTNSILENIRTEQPTSSGYEELKEVNIDYYLDNNLEEITLKKPNEVYYEMYKKAREKAKKAKREALVAYLEAKNIKETYMLEDLDSSDESDDSMEQDEQDEEVENEDEENEGE